MRSLPPSIFALPLAAAILLVGCAKNPAPALLSNVAASAKTPQNPFPPGEGRVRESAANVADRKSSFDWPPIAPPPESYAVYKVAATVEKTGAAEDSTPAAETSAATEAPAEKPKMDPVAVNGEIFVDWPKPQLAILFSGELDGYIEPCGCAGLENQKGGLKRRYTLIKQLQSQGWPLVLLDVGGLTKRLGPQTEVKLCHELDALVKMGYSAVGLGTNELRLDVDKLVYPLINLEPEENPTTSANVSLYAPDSGMSHRYRVIERGGKRIGVTSVLGASHVAELKNQHDIILEDPVAALKKVAAELATKNCDLQVLLVHGVPDEARELSKQFPQFQIVMAAGGAEEPPAAPKTIEATGAALIEVGHKGMYVVVMGIFDDPKHPYRFQRVPLDSRFADAPEMQEVLRSYQQELEMKGLDGLGLSGNPNPEGDFAGSTVCGDCHTKAMAVWEKSPHAHATDTLVKLDPPRHFDPECLSCHVTGWNPQEYFPYSTGYLSLDATPDLKQNGCENCHGPAKAHVDAELGNVEATDAQIKELRAGLHLALIDKEGNKEGQKPGPVTDMCMKCHDLDNSPDFDFQKYWPEIEHHGVD